MKTIELGLIIVKDVCIKNILECIKRFEFFGRRYCNRLATKMNEIGVNEAVLLLSEHKMFSSFRANIFTDMVVNYGFE
jgi:hypothetical protein